MKLWPRVWCLVFLTHGVIAMCSALFFVHTLKPIIIIDFDPFFSTDLFHTYDFKPSAYRIEQ